MATASTNKPPEVEIKRDFSFKGLVQTSDGLKRCSTELVVATRMSLTGITNLVVNHEDPLMVDAFLLHSFKMQDLYNNTIEIDAIELQGGGPGKGRAAGYLDELIFGKIEMEKDPNSDMMLPVYDAQTGKRKRKSDGFVNRNDVKQEKAKDITLIIRNLDYALDFCKSDAPGEIDSRTIAIFDNFRHASVRNRCRLLLVTNKPLKLPFNIRTVEMPRLTEFEARHLIDAFFDKYRAKYTLKYTEPQITQMCRKLCGLIYTESGDALAYALSRSESPKDSKIIDVGKALKLLRDKINANFLENGHGLQQLTARPWEDYICPASSNFTYDVEKMLRDFKEIETVKKEEEVTRLNGGNTIVQENVIEAIQKRIPHVIVLYGKGGVGKSAFPIHLAGLLDFDVWDFNVNATHSKWIGEGSKQMRESLKKISQTSHVVVRIDEYDRAIGASGESGNGMHEAHKQVESEFMNWLQNSQEEGLFAKQNIIVVMTTNHKENITGPLLRSGRTDLVIDIDNFDAESMKKTYQTCARRMYNRGVTAIGFDTPQALQEEVNKLDLTRLSELSTLKGFTVRDIEMLIMEMAAHEYYHKRYGGGLQWNNDTFVKVLEQSQGSTRDMTTGELSLGDRKLLMEMKNGKPEVKDDKQLNFPWFTDNIYDPNKFKEVNFFKP